jgi:lipid II:glycine glycyltransferase (peptidoglycan interpeptide bridge formation enzyme)
LVLISLVWGKTAKEMKKMKKQLKEVKKKSKTSEIELEKAQAKILLYEEQLQHEKNGYTPSAVLSNKPPTKTLCDVR